MESLEKVFLISLKIAIYMIYVKSALRYVQTLIALHKFLTCYLIKYLIKIFLEFETFKANFYFKNIIFFFEKVF